MSISTRQFDEKYLHRPLLTGNHGVSQKTLEKLAQLAKESAASPAGQPKTSEHRRKHRYAHEHHKHRHAWEEQNMRHSEIRPIKIRDKIPKHVETEL